MQQQWLQQPIGTGANGPTAPQEQQQIIIPPTKGGQHIPDAVVTAHQYRYWWMGLGVLILLAVAGCQEPAPAAGQGEVWQAYEAASEVKLIRLPDRSKVWLNAASSIRFDSAFSGGKREIWLQGEAYFEVDTAAGRLFEVHTGPVTTRLLSASFNIDAYDTLKHGITVTVKQGDAIVLDTTTQKMATLIQNQRVVYQGAGNFSQDTVAAETQMAWASGQSVFTNMKLGEVAKRLERKYGVEMIFNDTTIRDCSITASFDHTLSLQDILNKIAVLNGSEIRRGENPRQFYISGKKNCK